MSEKNSRVITAGGTPILVLALCLFLGCAPRQPPTDLYLDAVALRELGQNELAVGKLNAVVAADPGFALAYAELGKAYQALGDREKALAAFEQGAKLAPWSVENHLNVGKIRESLDQYPSAAEAYTRAADLDPKNLEALQGAAKCYLQAGEHTKSLRYCQLAEKAGANPAEALPLMARAYEAQEDYEQAKVRVDRMKKVSPIAGKVEHLFVEAGESVEALGDVVRLVQIDPLWIDVPVPIEKAKRLKAGDVVPVAFLRAVGPAGKEEFVEDDRAEGKVIFVAAVSDSAAAALTVRVEVPNPKGRPAGEPVRVLVGDVPGASREKP